MKSCISVLQEGRIFTGSCFSIRKSRLPEWTARIRWCACRGARFVCHSRSIGFIVFLMKTRLWRTSIPVIRSAYWMPLWFVMHSLNSLILEDSRSNADILQSEKHRCRKRGLWYRRAVSNAEAVFVIARSSALCVGNPAISGRTIACIAVCAQRFVLFMRSSEDKGNSCFCCNEKNVWICMRISVKKNVVVMQQWSGFIFYCCSHSLSTDNSRLFLKKSGFFLIYVTSVW